MTTVKYYEKGDHYKKREQLAKLITEEAKKLSAQVTSMTFMDNGHGTLEGVLVAFSD